MQFVWQHNLWPTERFESNQGHRVEVIDRGTLNRGDGPDFCDAVVRIDGQTWAGSIEMHVRASDWYRHGHHNDPAYANVVLHVVAVNDTLVRRGDGTVPQILLPCDSNVMHRYAAMMQAGENDLPCGPGLADIQPMFVTDFVTALAVGRLERKSADICRILDANGGDWTAAAFVVIARALGFGSNADSMERVARAVPLAALLKQSDNPLALEAVLMGCGGLLQPPGRDEREEALCAEYDFYSRKFGLSHDNEDTIIWHRRVRPANRPVRRLATLALFMSDSFAFARRLFALDDAAGAAALFEGLEQPGNYWQTHSTPGTLLAKPSALLTANVVNLLMINAVAPLVYAYGRQNGYEGRSDLACEILMRIPAEDNSIIRMFAANGLHCRDAFGSQALIQLKRHYCDRRDCVRCRFGRRLLTRAAQKLQ